MKRTQNTIIGSVVVIKEMQFFCFPCLSFGSELVWTKTGITNLNRLNDRMKKHDLTVKHMNNTMNLATLGKTNVLSMLDSSYRRGIYCILFFKSIKTINR